MSRSNFGRALTAMREERGLSRADAARLARVAPTTMGRQERSSACQMRVEKIVPLLDHLHTLSPLTKSELALLRRQERLKGYEPRSTTRSGERSPAEVGRAYKGRLRDACETAHRQILAEASAADYLAQLTRSARELGVKLEL